MSDYRVKQLTLNLEAATDSTNGAGSPEPSKDEERRRERRQRRRRERCREARDAPPPESREEPPADLSDLDLAHAERVLAAEGGRPPTRIAGREEAVRSPPLLRVHHHPAAAIDRCPSRTFPATGAASAAGGS